MPTYNFVDEDGVETSVFMSISEMERYKVENPNLRQVLGGSVAICDPIRMGRQKPDSGFRDLLTGIKRKYPGSSVNDF